MSAISSIVILLSIIFPDKRSIGHTVAQQAGGIVFVANVRTTLNGTVEIRSVILNFGFSSFQFSNNGSGSPFWLRAYDGKGNELTKTWNGATAFSLDQPGFLDGRIFPFQPYYKFFSVNSFFNLDRTEFGTLTICSEFLNSGQNHGKIQIRGTCPWSISKGQSGKLERPKGSGGLCRKPHCTSIML